VANHCSRSTPDLPCSPRNENPPRKHPPSTGALAPVQIRRQPALGFRVPIFKLYSSEFLDPFPSGSFSLFSPSYHSYSLTRLLESLAMDAVPPSPDGGEGLPTGGVPQSYLLDLFFPGFSGMTS
jgi:hypothetical protein